MYRIVVLVLSVAFLLPLDASLTSEAKAVSTPSSGSIQAGNGDNAQFVAKGKKGKKKGKKGKKKGKKGKKKGVSA